MELCVVLVADHVDEDLLVALVQVVLVRGDHLVGPVGGAAVHLLFIQSVDLLDALAGHEEIDAGQNALGDGLADARGGVVDGLVEVGNRGFDLVGAPFEHLLLRRCGHLHVVGVGRGGRLDAQGHIAPRLRQQEVVVGAQEPRFGDVKPDVHRKFLGVDLRLFDGLDVAVGVLDAFVELRPGVVDRRRAGAVVVAVGTRFAVVVVVEVAEVVGVGDLQRVVVAVERFAVQHAVDARQTVDQLLFAVVVAVVGDDLRIGVEEAARRKGGGEQRQRSQFQYAFDFHGVMLRLNR